MLLRSLRSCALLELSIGFLLSTGLISNAPAQTILHFVGHVNSSSGAKISGAMIVVTEEETGQTVEKVSQADGTYSIDVRPGAYSFAFSADGYTGATFHHVMLPNPDAPSSALDAVLPPLPRNADRPGDVSVPKGKIDGGGVPPSDIDRNTGRSFLVGTENEQSGFGLYSYLLFSSAPITDTEKQRDLAVLKVFIEGMNDVAEFESYKPKADLNVTYLLVVEHPQQSVPSPEWVLSKYNFVRAQVLLGILGRSGHDVRQGPYVVSATKPLSHLTEIPEPHLWQDMSSVSPTVAASWEKEFITRASRKEFWAPDTRNQALLDLRTFIANAANATTMASGGMGEFKKLLLECVSWNKE